MPWVQADAGALPLRPKSVQCVVTSPPYLAQRDYGGGPLQVGLEGTLSAYVARLCGCLEQLRAPGGRPELGCLRDDGLLWLNLGDKSNGSGGAGGDWTKAARLNALGKGPGRFKDPAYAEGSFLDVAGAVAAGLLRLGWRLRMRVVWDKGVEMRESLEHVLRPRPAHEDVLLLSPFSDRRRQRVRFFPDRLKETGSVWHFPPGGSLPHLAPFPDELAMRCLLPSTEPGDLVLDPFSGSGTVGRVAAAYGRRSASLDLLGPPGWPLAAEGLLA